MRMGIVADYAEDQARARLKANRALATGLLLLSGAVLVGTYMVPEEGFAVLLARAASEAGIVGGLADWFAVSALFRRPLGLPIPHTAIVPNNKGRIAEALGLFVERNFLTEETVLRKLREVRASKRLTAWLTTPETVSSLAHSIATALPYIVRSLDDSDLQRFAQATLGEQLRKADVAGMLARAIDLLGQIGEADELFARVAEIAADWLKTNRMHIDQLVHERSPWWLPRTVDRKIAAEIVDGVIELLGDLKDPTSEPRRKFKTSLTDLVNELLKSPNQRAEINAAKNRILDHPEFQAWLGAIWRRSSGALLEDLAKPDSETRAGLERAILLFARALEADEAMQRHIDVLLERLAVYVISWRSAIGSFISEVVKSWDTKVLTERLELVVGSDLQYIRMNGTVVGAIAGCLIFLATQMFSA
jgi:uncharacterized membrane-anchored protein YjiN (DUF445 family)